MPMDEFTLAYEKIEERRGYDVLISRAENSSEQRRLKNIAPMIGFALDSPALTPDGVASYLSFYDTVSGAYETFLFTSPFDGVQYQVRFSDEGIKTTSAGGVRRCSFDFVVLAVEPPES